MKKLSEKLQPKTKKVDEALFSEYIPVEALGDQKYLDSSPGLKDAVLGGVKSVKGKKGSREDRKGIVVIFTAILSDNKEYTFGVTLEDAIDAVSFAYDLGMAKMGDDDSVYEIEMALKNEL